MGLDISVFVPETGESLEINWLRNPYGLERWARANYVYAKKEPEPETDLWDITNGWNYDKGEQIDRPLFLQVVKHYGEVILGLEQGYFWFDESAYNHFVRPHEACLSSNLSVQYEIWGEQHTGIPMEAMGHPVFKLSDKYRPDAHTLANYKKWYQQLIDIAEMLQRPETLFYCSN